MCNWSTHGSIVLKVKGIVLFPEGFTVENELLTPNFKMKRPELKKRFMEDIAKLYALLDQVEVITSRLGCIP